jgi:hypothetical protein
VTARSIRVRRGGVLLLALAVTGLTPLPVVGQGGAWPTLSDAGLEYLSSSGFLQVSLSGQLDLEALHVGLDRWAGLVGGEVADSVPADWVTACADCHRDEDVRQRGRGGTILAHRLRLFTDVFVGDHVYALVEVRSDRGHAPARGSIRARVEQAFARVSNASGTLGVQAGKFASSFGAYALRHLTVADPFLRPPLAYDYRTVMNDSHAPGSTTGFLAWKSWPELFRLPGAPPVWDVPYQWGAMAFGRVGPVDLRAAAMNSAPSSDPESWDFRWERLEHPSFVIGARTRPNPSVELGVSYNRGPWLDEIVAGSILPEPGGAPRSRWDFSQETFSVDASFARGGTMARAEMMVDFWEVPNITERLQEIAYGAEIQTDLSAGFSLAGRLGYLDFRPVRTTGTPTDWDRDVVRFEASLGYRIVRNGGVVVSSYWQEAGREDTTMFTGARIWWAF